MIALIAKRLNIPVIVCCETYKFSDRYQLDSLTKNELGNPDRVLHNDNKESSSALVKMLNKSKHAASSSSQQPLFSVYNLTFDLTPSELLDLVITEVGLIPPSSVAVIIREYFREN